MTDRELVTLAKRAAESSYSPYSDFTVGAALLTRNGKTYTGCNIENSAFGPTNCAERTAVFKAVSEGEREFCAIAIVGGLNDQLSETLAPCGVCRQVLAEFCNDSMPVIMGTPEKITVSTLGELLPSSFGKSSLNV